MPKDGVMVASTSHLVREVGGEGHRHRVRMIRLLLPVEEEKPADEALLWLSLSLLTTSASADDVVFKWPGGGGGGWACQSTRYSPFFYLIPEIPSLPLW